MAAGGSLPAPVTFRPGLYQSSSQNTRYRMSSRWAEPRERSERKRSLPEARPFSWLKNELLRGMLTVKGNGVEMEIPCPECWGPAPVLVSHADLRAASLPTSVMTVAPAQL